jgi:hypothetical protein
MDFAVVALDGELDLATLSEADYEACFYAILRCGC